MISASDVETFERQGYLVVENLLDEATLAKIRTEYAELLDDLYDSWHAAGLVPAATPEWGSGTNWMWPTRAASTGISPLTSRSHTMVSRPIHRCTSVLLFSTW